VAQLYKKTTMAQAKNKLSPKIIGPNLLVDDHAVVRFGIAQLINRENMT